jgi:hypothetical protein
MSAKSPIRLSRRAATAAVALLSSTTLLLTAAPSALASGKPVDNASRIASVVEKATGTGSIAASTQTQGAVATTTVSTRSGSVTTVVPEQAQGRIQLAGPDGESMSLSLPAASNSSGVKAGNGTIVYPDAGQATDLAVQPTTQGGARALIKLNDASAPKTQRFTLNLPVGATAVPDRNGGFELVRPVSDGAEVIGTVAAPWAKDANGKPVRTSYKLDGNQLIQTIDTNAKTAFPVVADPTVSLGWAVYVRWNKDEVHNVATKIAGGVAVGDFLCDQIPNHTAQGFCKAVGGATLLHLGNVFSNAAKENKCVEVKCEGPRVFRTGF